jgi:hypothetical protein
MRQTTSDQIERHIRTTREQLRGNLDELEDRVKSTVNWRKQFRRNPGLGMGLAVGAGFLLAALTARPRRQVTGESLTPASIRRRGHVNRFWDNFQSTLTEIAAVRATELLTGALRRRSHEPLREADRDAPDVQGEGDYRAARRYGRSAESFAHSADVSRAARQAAPRTPAEAAEMAQAEAEGAARARRS